MATGMRRPTAGAGALAFALALVRCAHPGPCAVVTAAATGLAALAGAAPGRVTLAAAAVLSGQLSVGWANDWLDAARDHAAGRTDKPAATGVLPPATLRTAAVLALAGAVALTAPLGAVPLATHLAAVALAWGYNLGLKATPFSVVPYAGAFALLPAFAAAVAGGTAPWWALTAAGLLGAGAHFTNAVDDLAADVRTGVRGLPHRLGARGSMLTAAGLLGAGLAVAVGGARSAGADPPVWAVAVLAAALAVVVGLGLLGNGRAAFRLTMLTALGVLAVLAFGAAPLLGA